MNRFKIYALLFAFLSCGTILETIRIYKEYKKVENEYVIMSGLKSILFLYLIYRNWKKSN